MHLHYLNQQPSLLSMYLNELRDINSQQNRLLFRDNLKKIGAIMAYEMSKTLRFHPISIKTPLGVKSSVELEDNLAVLSILRAGLALHQGFIDTLPLAAHGFVSAYRKHLSEFEFEIKVEYKAMPNLSDRVVWLVDPMLATGKSLVAVLDYILRQNPKTVHLAVVVAAPEGIAYLKENLPKEVHLWIADQDDYLNEHQYIVPGLGDAGDLAYGEKI